MVGTGLREAIWAALIFVVVQTGAPASPPTEEKTQPGASATAESGFLPRHSPAASPRATPGIPGLGAVSLMGPMLIVVGALIVLALMVKRWGLGKGGSGRRGGLEILSRQYLSNKQSLCVVRFGKRVVCLGVTPERISTLAQLDDADEASQVVAAAARSLPSSFTQVLSTMPAPTAEIEQDGAPQTAGAPTSVVAKDVRQLLGRVRAMADAQSTPEAA